MQASIFKTFLLLVLLPTACQKISNDQHLVEARVYEGEACQATNLKSAMTLVWVEKFIERDFGMLDEPHQIWIFENDGQLKQIQSSSPIVLPSFIKLKKSQSPLVYESLKLSRFSFGLPDQPKITLACKVISQGVSLGGDFHGDKRVSILPGDLLFSTSCAEGKECLHLIFRKLDESSLPKTYEHPNQ